MEADVGTMKTESPRGCGCLEDSAASNSCVACDCPAESAVTAIEREPEKTFEPQILAYCCIYCAFAAADLAGSMRLQYPPNVKIIKLPCTGKLDILHVMRSFESGVDGVFVAGCLEGNCHFLKGNFRAKKRVEYTRTLLEEAGLEPERLEMVNMSSAMGIRFADVARSFTEKIKALGPNPVGERAGREASQCRM